MHNVGITVAVAINNERPSYFQVFDQLSEDTITALRDDRDLLKSTLQNHITRGKFICQSQQKSSAFLVC